MPEKTGKEFLHNATEALANLQASLGTRVRVGDHRLFVFGLCQTITGGRVTETKQKLGYVDHAVVETPLGSLVVPEAILGETVDEALANYEAYTKKLLSVCQARYSKPQWTTVSVAVKRETTEEDKKQG